MQRNGVVLKVETHTQNGKNEHRIARQSKERYEYFNLDHLKYFHIDLAPNPHFLNLILY